MLLFAALIIIYLTLGIPFVGYLLAYESNSPPLLDDYLYYLVIGFLGHVVAGLLGLICVGILHLQTV